MKTTRSVVESRMAERALGDWLTHLERIHPAEIDLGLSRTSRVARTLGLLPYTIPTLVVAGTNGKGSVVYASDAVLRAHGRRTGRYTSPHLLRYNERIAVNGEALADAAIVDAFDAIEAARGDTTLTYFEFSTLAALWLFRQARVDVAILEVGLGGRLDAVNIVDADLAVVTAIDLDHQNWLGDTVDAIAPEKAAVARAGRPVILAEKHYPATLFGTLSELGAVALRAGDAWSWSADGSVLKTRLARRVGSCSGGGSSSAFAVDLPAGLRPANVAAALQASAQILGDAFDAASAREALGTLVVPGRRQRIAVDGRELVLDVAHNPAAMAALVDYLARLEPVRQTVAAVGMMADKDIGTMLRQLAAAVDGAWALALPGIARAAAPEELWQALDAAGIASAQPEFSLEAVWSQLMAGTAPGDRIVVCGSFYSVAGIMALLPAGSLG